MPRGTNRAEGLSIFAMAHSPYGIASCTGGQRCSVPGSERYNRIGLDSPCPLIAPSVQLFDVFWRMISLALLDRCSEPVGFLASLDPAIFFEHRIDIGDASDAFGVTARVVLFKDWTVVQKHGLRSIYLEKVAILWT